MPEPSTVIEDIKRHMKEVRDAGVPPNITTFFAPAWMVRSLGIKVHDNIKDGVMVQVVTTYNEVTVTEVS